ncbi:SDH family Clp fold serine proteinase [Parafilimonas sp.]|uniref:SDH family Clp fold serine proteinase n=1 Tax=Parafilimonas sp. TaxID=1969739 RepID=UPI0039E50E27
MSKNRNKKPTIQIPNQQKHSMPQPQTVSLLDSMIDGREFESLLQLKNVNVNVLVEIRRALKDIGDIRGHSVIAYLANVVNVNVKASKSIEYSDDLPFSELVNTIPANEKHIDIILVTPGGSGTQVAKFVDKLRPRFDTVSFILPDIAMSAGTIFAMSGDEIIMTNNSYIGPIDPQVPNKDGMFVPAQSILTLIEHIQSKGEAAIKKGLNPDWTDLQILRQIDPKEIGNAINASKYSVELVENYLHDYKFKTWANHSNGNPVTPDERKQRANQIANQLCNHSLWKSHGRGITREAAWSVCQLKITHSETINLDRAIKRFWALFYWLFENTPIYKTFVSDYYSLMRNDRSLINQK